jgi:hypothetical protein
MILRKLMTVLAATCVAALVVPMVAAAQPTARSLASTAQTHATSFSHIPVTGVAHNGKKFTGQLNISQFVTRNGKTYAVGVLTGKLGHRHIAARQVALPATVPHTGLAGGPLTTRAGAAAACPVLNLTLGPLDLNLLGLTVHLNQVVLNITAQSGAGNLLGNLVCSVANLLNGPSLLTQDLSGLLNVFQQLVGNPGLLSL